LTAYEIKKHMSSLQVKPEQIVWWEIALQLAELNEQIGKGRLTPIVVTGKDKAP
jgi:hypothetical protein